MYSQHIYMYIHVERIAYRGFSMHINNAQLANAKSTEMLDLEGMENRLDCKSPVPCISIVTSEACLVLKVGTSNSLLSIWKCRIET